MFERADWTLFRNLNTISQKAGVALQQLRRVVYKEIVDNGLDAKPGTKVEMRLDKDGWFHCTDHGPGIDLPPDKIAELFSINRPLTSTKILRVPSRGALGNGLRVIVGTVMASGGQLRVETKGKSYEFAFDDSKGTSRITRTGPSPVEGTRISVLLGRSVPSEGHDLDTLWARLANTQAQAELYMGKSSPWWYDSDSFYELFMAAGERKTLWLIRQFDGVTDRNAELLVGQAPAHCHDVTREAADAIMNRMRIAIKPVNVKKIGHSGWGIKKTGEIVIQPGHGKHEARLPFVVEAYASPVNENPSDDTSDTQDDNSIFVNSTPITGKVRIQREGASKVAMFGCGLQHYIKNVSKRRFHMYLNVTIPYMPITTDGKEPNFKYMLSEINTVMSRATSKFKSAMKKLAGGGQRDIILRNIDTAVDAASGGGTYRYSLRQLFYAVRPYILEKAENAELDYNYFARVITEYESEYGELQGIYRDPRGTLYHPHLGRSIPIGTLAVEEYKRPKWTFNKILYCEKEGFFSVLQQVKWPEQNDCALLSSKGFASRAVRDVMDLLGETEEEIQFFCIHDADASGTLIYQSLVEGTTARAARKVKVINLGLDPWTASEMGLQVETFTPKKPLPVARYIREYDDENGERWQRWLQGKRVELNAMTSPMFLEWLDEKMAPYTKGKVVPPEDVLRQELRSAAEAEVRAQIQQELLSEAGFETLVAKRMKKTTPKLDEVQIDQRVRLMLKQNPAERWDNPLRSIASEVVGEG